MLRCIQSALMPNIAKCELCRKINLLYRNSISSSLPSLERNWSRCTQEAIAKRPVSGSSWSNGSSKVVQQPLRRGVLEEPTFNAQAFSTLKILRSCELKIEFHACLDPFKSDLAICCLLLWGRKSLAFHELLRSSTDYQHKQYERVLEALVCVFVCV